jgi:WbqC-like protein family
MPVIVSGHQPVYLPWLGLFHKASLADVFVLMDDAQYLEQDWNNRNRLKGSCGPFWLTVPIARALSSSKSIRDIRIHSPTPWGSSRHWQHQHWKSIQLCYGKAKFWSSYAAKLENLYLSREHEWLWELNYELLKFLLSALGLEVRLVISSDVGFKGRKSDLVLEHATTYHASICVVGVHGNDYLREDDFFRAGISIHFQDYRHPIYRQRFGDFVSHLSVIDLLMNCGPDSLATLCRGNVDKAYLLRELSATTTPRRIESPPSNAAFSHR